MASGHGLHPGPLMEEHGRLAEPGEAPAKVQHTSSQHSIISVTCMGSQTPGTEPMYKEMSQEREGELSPPVPGPQSPKLCSKTGNFRSLIRPSPAMRWCPKSPRGVTRFSGGETEAQTSEVSEEVSPGGLFSRHRNPNSVMQASQKKNSNQP